MIKSTKTRRERGEHMKPNDKAPHSPPSPSSHDEEQLPLSPIAYIRTPYPTKFGIPRQSGLVEESVGRIIFTPAYRDPLYLRGIEEFSHLWLIWGFSAVFGHEISPTVRPPKLGGNERKGVFATRSPFRPNPIGLSSVRLLSVEQTGSDGSTLSVGGVDLLDGTPIYDIKPYLAFTDAHPDASAGFSAPIDRLLPVVIPGEIRAQYPPAFLVPLEAVLAQDPRPAYHDDPTRVYAFEYDGHHIAFRVADGMLTVTGITPLP